MGEVKPRRSFILTYHSLDESRSPISVSPGEFVRHMEALAQHSIPVVQLEALCSQPPGAVAITFDDGFENFMPHALPVLQHYGFPATIFAVSGYCGGRNNWSGQAPGIPILPLLDWVQLKEISATGIEIGSHTIEHPRLTLLAATEVERQLSESKQEIEDRLGKPVKNFAYPYGDLNPQVRELAGKFFTMSCGVRLRYLGDSDDSRELPRLDAYYLRNPFWFERIVSPAGEGYIWARRQLRVLRAALQ